MLLYPRLQDFFLSNAWDERGEGMVLEPSNQFGDAFLEAILRAKEIVASVDCDFKRISKE